MSDHAELDLPLSARYATTVRAVAASMASTLGMSVDAIDDLRLGVNEAISVLTDLDEADRADARLHVRFELEDDAIRVTADRRGVTVDEDLAIDVLARRILGAVVDEYALGDDGVFLLVKRVRTDGGT